ncbi:MAG: cytochrome c maturation protein CcmE, partial [Flavobacteriaceae bacterium]
MTRKQRRLTIIGAAGVVLAIAAGLVLYAFNDTIVFFKTPPDLAEQPVAPGTRLRLGGLVKEGS